MRAAFFSRVQTATPINTFAFRDACCVVGVGDGAVCVVHRAQVGRGVVEAGAGHTLVHGDAMYRIYIP